MTHPLDAKQPILDKLIADHPMFEELKTIVDSMISTRYKKTKKLAGESWKGYKSNAQYLSEITKNNNLGNKIASVQRQILDDINLLDDRSFACFRSYSVNWDKVREWEI
jgi:phosphomevalonate kinase